MIVGSDSSLDLSSRVLPQVSELLFISELPVHTPAHFICVFELCLSVVREPPVTHIRTRACMRTPRIKHTHTHTEHLCLSGRRWAKRDNLWTGLNVKAIIYYYVHEDKLAYPERQMLYSKRTHFFNEVCYESCKTCRREFYWCNIGYESVAYLVSCECFFLSFYNVVYKLKKKRREIIWSGFCLARSCRTSSVKLV